MLKPGIKWAIGIGSGLALLTVGFIVLKQKKSSTSSESDVAEGGAEEKPKGSFVDTLFGKKDEIKDLGGALTTGNAPAGTVFKVDSYEKKTTGNTDLILTFASPRPAKGDIKSNNKIVVAGMGDLNGEYRVYFNPLNPMDKGVWIDSQDKVGAIYIKTGKVKENKSGKTATGTVTKV